MKNRNTDTTAIAFNELSEIEQKAVELRLTKDHGLNKNKVDRSDWKELIESIFRIRTYQDYHVAPYKIECVDVDVKNTKFYVVVDKVTEEFINLTKGNGKIDLSHMINNMLMGHEFYLKKEDAEKVLNTCSFYKRIEEVTADPDEIESFNSNDAVNNGRKVNIVDGKVRVFSCLIGDSPKSYFYRDIAFMDNNRGIVWFANEYNNANMTKADLYEGNPKLEFTCTKKQLLKDELRCSTTWKIQENNIQLDYENVDEEFIDWVLHLDENAEAYVNSFAIADNDIVPTTEWLKTNDVKVTYPRLGRGELVETCYGFKDSSKFKKGVIFSHKNKKYIVIDSQVGAPENKDTSGLFAFAELGKKSIDRFGEAKNYKVGIYNGEIESAFSALFPCNRAKVRRKNWTDAVIETM